MKKHIPRHIPAPGAVACAAISQDCLNMATSPKEIL